jgi:glycosyltransferase
MKISVVTICRNAERTIGRTIESFLGQDYPDKEMLIVDGASDDATLAIARSFGAAALQIHSARDCGIYDAMNKGLALYRGDAVGFLNADDRFHDSGALKKIAAGLCGSDAVYGDLLMIRRERIVRHWQAGPQGAFHSGWMPPHPTFYVRRELAQAVGGFNPAYDIAADYDFMLRALELHRGRARYIPETLVDFRTGGRSTRNLAAVIRANLQCLHSRRRNLGASRLDWALFTKPARKLGQLRWS